MGTVEISMEDANRIIEHCDKCSIEIDGEVTRIPAIHRLINAIFLKKHVREAADLNKPDKACDKDIKSQLWATNEHIDELAEDLEDSISALEFRVNMFNNALNDIYNRIEKLEFNIEKLGSDIRHTVLRCKINKASSNR